VLLLFGVGSCAATPERPANSTVACAQAVVAALPPGLSDPEKHCLASAGIARQCSLFEAWLAAWGKEVQDAFGAGDAAREDLVADRLGRQCAAQPGNPQQLLACCRRSLADPAG
jgi:hypothetical protein